MKLAFSTLGCPDWHFKDMLAIGKDLGYGGIEIRGIEDELYAPKIRAFYPDKIESTLQRLKDTDMEIACLTSQAELAIEEKSEVALKEVKDYMLLAARLGVKYVRVMCENSLDSNNGDFEVCLRNYQVACQYGESIGVTPLMETNAMFCDTALLARLMERTASQNKGVVWDFHHPFRFKHEAVAQTVANIGRYVKHTHMKDSLIKDGKLIYKMSGYGDNPNKEAIAALIEIGYDGYYTLEWVKRWNKELEEAGIVFAHFTHYMKHLM